MNFPSTIAEYITGEESAYKTDEVSIFDNFSWNMPTHIQNSISFKHGKFTAASNDPKFKPPFRNIVLTNLRLRYRAEDIDVTDVVLFIEEPEKHHLSFLVKKYHDDVFIIENDLDSFFDKAKEEKIDLGGTLVKKGVGAVPEVIPLQSIAFCDQTDIMGGPIGLKFNYSPDKLRAIAKEGWGDEKNGATISIEDLILLAKSEKDSAGNLNVTANKTTGKNIEVYVVRGQMPEKYLKSDGGEDLVNQVQVVAFYASKSGKTSNILYRQKETEEVYKFHNPEAIFNRALGFGGVEEIFDDQVNVNFAEIHKKNLLRNAGTTVLQTDDEAFANRNKVIDMQNLEITVTKEGTRIDQIPTANPNSIQLFTQSLMEWESHAREVGGATDPLLGKQPPAGTPFAQLQATIQQGQGLHDYRRGKFAKFIEEIYRDWIIPQIAKEIVKGKKFLSTLSSDEMQWLFDKVAHNRAVKQQWEDLFNGKMPVDLELLKQTEIEKLMQGGNKQFLEIIKGELKDVHLKVKVNVAGKQKNLGLLTDNLVNVLRQYLVTPQLRQDPTAMKLLNRLLEASNMSPVDFSELLVPQPAQPVSTSSTSPLKDIAKQPVAV